MSPSIFVLAGISLMWLPSYLAWRAGARDAVDQQLWLMGKPVAFVVCCRELEHAGFAVLVCGAFLSAWEAMSP